MTIAALEVVLESPPYSVHSVPETGLKVISCTSIDLGNNQNMQKLLGMLRELRGESYILDISKANWVSLSSVRELLSEFRRGRQMQGTPKIVCGPYLFNLLELTGTAAAFEPYATLDDALKS